MFVIDITQCVGKTVSTGGMERRGIPPVRVSGIEFVSSKNIRTKDSKNEQRNKMLRERQLALEEIQSKKNARNEEKESS